MSESPEQARAVLESEGWTFLLSRRQHPTWPVVLSAHNRELRVTREVQAENEDQAWALMLQDGEP
jgi:hypothetical protein